MQRIAPTRLVGLLLCASTTTLLGCAGKIVPGRDTSPATAADGSVDDAGDLGADASMPDDVENTFADAGQRTDAGRGGAMSASDAGRSTDPESLGLVPLFVAVGEMGRTEVSCDDGKTWVAHRAARDNPCSGSECDHSDQANSGLAYNSEAHRWFSTRGWGYDGPIEYTDDGQTWTTVQRTGRWNGIAAGGGSVYIQGGPTLTTGDNGASWVEQMQIMASGHIRGQVHYADGKFWVLSDAGEIYISTDKGRTWEHPKAQESRCAKDWQMHQGGLAYGNDVIVMVAWKDGVVCRSTDHGQTFMYATTFGDLPSTPLIFADGQFWIWSSGTLHRSRDGASWETLQTNFPRLGPVARSDQGTWVTADSNYDDEKIARSTDGVRWEVLPKSSYTSSHRLRMISFGYGKRPSACR